MIETKVKYAPAPSSGAYIPPTPPNRTTAAIGMPDKRCGNCRYWAFNRKFAGTTIKKYMHECLNLDANTNKMYDAHYPLETAEGFSCNFHVINDVDDI